MTRLFLASWLLAAFLGLTLSPTAFAAAPADVVMVLNSRDDTMSLIDPHTYKEIRRVPIGKQPHHLLPTPDGKYLLVADAVGNALQVIDPHTGKRIRTIPNIADPYQLGFSPDGRWFVANGNRLNRVDIYHYHDLNFRLAARLPMPRTPSHMTFTPDDTVYVTLQNSDKLVAIDLATQKVKWEVDTGPAPAGVWLTPDHKHLLVAATGADFFQVFDVRDGRMIKQVHTGKGAHNFQALGDGRHVFLSDRMGDNIVLIDEKTYKVVERFRLPGGPDDMELRADKSQLWVTSRWRAQVCVVDMKTKKVIHIIPVGRSPHGIYFNNHAPLL
jgi:YVTN family beta-propeller protein